MLLKVAFNNPETRRKCVSVKPFKSQSHNSRLLVCIQTQKKEKMYLSNAFKLRSEACGVHDTFDTCHLSLQSNSGPAGERFKGVRELLKQFILFL